MTFSSLRRAALRDRLRRPATLTDAPENGARVAPGEDDPTTGGSAGTAGAPTGRRRRRVLVAALSAGALVLTGAGVAVASAHKSVVLEVDGQERRVSTFSADVAGLLEDQGIDVGAHDSVAPQGGTALADGSTVVVRHGHRLAVQLDGAPTTVWSTALTADEALGVLRDRGTDVRLLVSRSTQGRAELPLDLGADRASRVDVTADGVTTTVPAAQDAAGALAAAGVTLAAADRVQVLHGADGRLTLLVQRVVTAPEPVASAVPFATQTRADAGLTVGRTRTLQAGVPGVRTQTFFVTRVDGVEESRRLVFDAVTTAPVDAIVAQGTKPRVVAAPVAGPVVGGDVWAALARCESGGNPASVSASGKYYGLYQFSLSTWRAMGGSGLPSEASAQEQTQRAQALQARSGWGQWPACAKKLGLL